MVRVSISKITSLRLLLLLCAIAATFITGILMERSATAWDKLPQESPLSPLEMQTEEGDTSPLIIPVAPAPAERTAPPLAEAPAGLTLPLGEPLKARTSLYLVGLVLAGLLGVVVLIVIRQRRT